MDKLYIATMIKKRKLEGGDMYICECCGVIAGLLFGTTFLSSRSKKYKPMINKELDNIDGYALITNEIDLSKSKFLLSEDKYAYYNLIEIKDYNTIEEEINNLYNKFKDVSYFINLDVTTPYIIRYKNSIINQN